MKETLLGCEVKAEERRRSETVITALTYTPIPDNPPANPEKTPTDKPDDEKTDFEKPHEPDLSACGTLDIPKAIILT
ncbi:hypothetical protein Pcinc_026754 [Petrolisthes cinctipes]|uniref:Uncharacterized protein n=1 Tax=Petrolisthes cinctipes TaxID=88211 RepID=A0AAE1F6S6_PETCI|nr:hypothetical protein Pcinc_026754 [Petrolisthes cinctipes]